MPRLSLYRPEKGNDFKFIDRVVNERFQVGGTDVYIHKYLGPVASTGTNITPTTPANTGTNLIKELGIQDVLFMENRDRNYEPDVYIIRGIYQMQDLDFNLSQFGLFLQNDTVNMYFHLRTHADALSRKIMAGDVIELPHLKDEYALDDSVVALKRFYVVQDVTRPTAGFSVTWYPHLVRAKCIPLVDSQEFSQILNQDSGAGDGSTLRDLLSTYNKSIEINDQIIEQAMLDSPNSGYSTEAFYVIPTRDSGLLDTADASDDIDDASMDQAVLDASMVLRTPKRNLYVGYLTGNAMPPNGAPFSSGIAFTFNPAVGAFFLRTDYQPNALYRFDGTNWVLYEKNVQMTMNEFGNQDTATGTFAGKQVRQTQKTSFINNATTSTINGQVITERQALSKVLKPKADI
jgi:hypothetical protein